ncbi:poly(ADP-ribose) polymerase family member 14-related sequence 1 isoform X2 [Myxocyprinus asiaticus]|uniref:poly(ADP-ribose) polymerase family member 14-related sequence 1 isoform X2 n=1 Tax=Myxocyprinus asiaticus TaxID=70543 RepID=UPI002222FB5A|nr:poly(ADP-ribose) polymerase family member 14-related sequence 1 isoform X2 [Myxocyprinus asiaticus]
MADEFPYALFVEGQWDPKTPKLKNKLNIYFQSKKSDGGDSEVEHDVSDGQRATVRFKTEEVRQRVLRKQTHELKIGKTNIKMTVRLPSSEVSTPEESTSSVSAITKGELKSEVEEEVEPTEEKEDTTCRSAVIENIQNNSQEFLVMLVENVLKGHSESKDFSIEIIPESHCAVVTFSDNMDTANFVKSCTSNAMIKKKNMNVRLLETTSKVKAEGLPSHTNSDYLLLYFEKFGEVEDDVVIFEEGQSAIMTFKNPKDVHSVIKEQHHIKKHPFRVLPYYETLQTALYGKDRPILTLPKAFTENIDETVWHHLKENQNSMDLINQAMSSYFCDLDFQSSAVTIKPLPSLLQQGGQTRKLIQTWREKASTEFSVSVSKFKSTEIYIQKDTWTEIESEIHKAVAAVTVTLVPYVDQGTMAVAGLKEDVNKIESILRGIVERITQRIQRKKGSEMDEIAMSPSIYKLFLCSGLKQQICDKFPELELTYHAHSQNLTLYGLKTEVLETKNEILQDVVDLIRQPVELHQSVLDFLHNKDLEKMSTDLFFTNGIDVSLVVEGKRALLVGKTKKALNDAERKLTADLGHLSFAVEDSSVLERSDWQDLVSYIRNTDTEVTVQTTVNEVVVSGFVDSIKDVEKKLCDFVKENSQTEKSLKAHKTVVKFIKDHKRQDWSEEVKGKISVNFKDDTILISGPYHHVTQYLPMFDTMLKSIQHCTMKIDKPGAKKFFKEKESMCVAFAKTNMGCLIQLIDQYETPHGLMKSDTKPTYQFKTPEGVEIAINKADICSFQVDAVVGASKETLLLDEGLAKALSDAAGPKLQDDCNKYVKSRQLMTGDAVLFDAGGQLRCKHVIFAIGPQYNSSKPQEAVTLLRKTVKKSLNLADQESCQSVAIPAISSAGFGFPLDLCADTIVKAIKEFCNIFGGDSVLSRIHLVDTNDITVRALEAAVKKMYGVTAVSHNMTTGGGPGLQQNQNQASSSSSQGQSAVHTQGASQSFQTKEGLTISILKGNIEDTTMDVVVNTLSSNLNLSVGAISNALLKAAGPQLQVLLNEQVTGTPNNGAVIVTTGANLKNQLVFHAVVPHWNQGQGSEMKMLEDIIDKCLNEAEKREQSSIVFSAIGTGNLGFPKALVVCTMLDLVLKFSNKRSSKHLQEVVFALHPKDTATIQVFTDEFNKRFMPQYTSANNPTQQQSTGPFSKVTVKSGIYETIVGGTTLQVLQGDITAEKTDVIVNSSNKEFTLKSGVSKAILDKAGPNVEAECQQLGAQPNKGLIMTQAGNLQCKKIIHISAQSNSNLIQKQAKKAMQMCAKEKFTSISFPAIGTGQAGMSPGQVADSMMDAVVDMVKQTPQSSLKLVRMVVFQAPMLTEFYKSMQNREVTHKQEESTWSKIKTYAASVKSFLTGSWEKEIKQHGGKDFVIEGIRVVDPLCLSICGPSQKEVDKTKHFIENMLSQEQTIQSITDTAILSFSDKDQQHIKDMQSTLDVTIRLEYKALKGSKGTTGEATLTVEGLTRDVLIAVQDIQDMLKSAREGEILKRDMEYTSEFVDWQYEQGGQYKSFDQRTNLELEQALGRGAADIKISLQGQSYQIKLPEGPAVSTSGGNQMNIRRIDKLKATESIPQNWDAMAPKELYKVCNLQPTSSEYKDVLRLFKASCPNKNVVKIERIQNPGMWKNYQNNKSVMEQKNGHQNNEKKLFHGTSEQTLTHINKSGFNRSYAGQNAAAYGNGTYFALNASYSASNTYSVPNAQGQKHMYLCRVLTGDFTRGLGGMIVPPPKTTTGFDLYDTVVDNPAAPTIFVVFRDDNAYPEYLITFT